MQSHLVLVLLGSYGGNDTAGLRLEETIGALVLDAFIDYLNLLRKFVARSPAARLERPALNLAIKGTPAGLLLRFLSFQRFERLFNLFKLVDFGIAFAFVASTVGLYLAVPAISKRLTIVQIARNC